MASQEGGTNWDPDVLRRQLQAMDDFQFEHLIADLWEEQGWDTKVEQQSMDAGIDVRAERSSPYSRKALIQAKRYSDNNTVGGPDIQQYSALKRQEPDADEVIVVTTGRFSRAAEERADELNVKTIDGDNLVSLIDDLDAYRLVEGYVGLPPGERRSTRESTRETRSRDAPIDVKEYLEEDLDAVREEDEYRRIRAKEREQDRVRLNPYDAAQLGIFDGLPEEVIEARFRDTKRERALLKDDLHRTDAGELFVEDLTDYINPAAIDTHASANVVGVVERGVKDGTWASENGYDHLKRKQRYQRYKRWAEQAIKKTKEWYQNYSEESHAENPNEEFETSDSGTTEPDPTPPADEIQSETAFASTVDQEQYKSEDRPDESREAVDIDDTIWYKASKAGTAAWAGVWGLVIAGILPTLSGILSLSAMILLPVGIVLDARSTGIASVAKKEIILYAIIGFIPPIGIFAGIAYLYRRNSGGWE